MLSPNDGSLAFSISSPVPLSPFRQTTTVKSPGDFSPSIFSSLKESTFFDESDHLIQKSMHKSDLNCFDIEGEDDVSRGFESYEQSTGSQIDGESESSSRMGAPLKKTLMYGRHSGKSSSFTPSRDQVLAALAVVTGSPSTGSTQQDHSDSSPEQDNINFIGRNQRARSQATASSLGPSASSRGARQLDTSEADKGAQSPDEATKCNCKKSKCLKL
jgi:hypothetical protein